MSRFLKSIAMQLPSVRRHLERVSALTAERDRLARELDAHLGHARHAEIARQTGQTVPYYEWLSAKQRRQDLSSAWQAVAATQRLTPLFDRIEAALEMPLAELVRQQVAAEPYWFQKIEVLPGLFSPGWSDAAKEKLPYYGLPADLTGMRVLDIGCAEGFFSFEAERRGAREVIGIDSFPDSVRRFNIVKAARQSNANAFLMNVYDLEPKRLGTFDLVLFYGVFYHLKHPQLALEKIRSICTGELRFQTHMLEEPAVKGAPWARFYPHGMMSGANQENYDPTVFWLFNSACCMAMLDHVGFIDATILSTDPDPFVVSARVPARSPGCPPDQTDSPWC